MDVTRLDRADKMIRRLLREPIVHFVLIGIALFAFNAVWEARRASADRTITLTLEEVERLTAIWAGEAGRVPGEEDILGLVRAHTEEEALYREALRLGLDEGDTIIRRRLAQKMQFMLDNGAEPDLPAEEELRTWFEERQERYDTPALRGFTHVFFSPERRGETVEADAAAALASLKEGAEWRETGDAFMLQRVYGPLSQEDVDRLFGPAFAEALFQAETGDWTGPIGSAFGLHLVRIDETRPAQSASFEAERARIEADWKEQARQRANLERRAEIVGKYELDLDLGD
ncbi:MAG: peptidylprolyl isomerase [Pseudomonadota bacterium]